MSFESSISKPNTRRGLGAPCRKQRSKFSIMLWWNMILQNQHQQAVILVSVLSHHQIWNFFHHLIVIILECQNCTVVYYFAISLSSLGSKLSNIFTGICISLWIMNKLKIYLHAVASPLSLVCSLFFLELQALRLLVFALEKAFQIVLSNTQLLFCLV